MIRNAVDLVEMLNKAFARSQSVYYPQAMAEMIVREFAKYSPDTLYRLFELICRKWDQGFGPPNLGEILKMISVHNDSVSKDKAIGPSYEKKQLPESTEPYVSKEKMAQFWTLMQKVMKIKDKKIRQNVFLAEKEKLLYGKG